MWNRQRGEGLKGLRNLQEVWISTDETEDVAGSIRNAILCFEQTKSDEQAWKWLALSLHSALQGACVCHLVTTASPIGATTQKNTVEWLIYHEARRVNENAKAPHTRLMNLPDLLKAIREPNSAGDRSNSIGVQLDDSEFQWLSRFHNEIRNQFTHFEPMGWSIEVSGFPKIAALVARIIEEIDRFGWAFRRQSTAWRQALVTDLIKLSSLQLL